MKSHLTFKPKYNTYVSMFSNQKNKQFYKIIGQYSPKLLKNPHTPIINSIDACKEDFGNNVELIHYSNTVQFIPKLFKQTNSLPYKPLKTFTPRKGGTSFGQNSLKDILYVSNKSSFNIDNFIDKIMYTYSIIPSPHEPLNCLNTHNSSIRLPFTPSFRNIHTPLKGIWLPIFSILPHSSPNYYHSKKNYTLLYRPYNINILNTSTKYNTFTFKSRIHKAYYVNRVKNQNTFIPLPKLYKPNFAIKLSNKLPHGLSFRLLSSGILPTSRLLHKNLTTSLIGPFLIKHFHFYKSIKNYRFNFLYKMKKLIYSFSKPNQLKQSILKRKSIVTLYTIINSQQSRTSLHNLTSHPTYLNSLIQKLNNNFSGTILNWADRSNTNLYTKFTSPLVLPVTQFTEVKLPRVRFKPGYQRIWRDARLALKDILGLKFLYQRQLTKYLTRFFKKSSNTKPFSDELTFYKIAVYSRIVPDYSTFSLFYSNHLFFINGKLPVSKSFNCVTGDLVQLVLSKWYYTFFRWVLNWSIIRLRKVKKLIYRKGLASQYISMKSRKQRSKSVPDWVFNTKYDFSDIKPFLEVDFFTLSFFIIYEPYTSYYYPHSSLLLPKTNIYKLYNWKYIT